MHASLRPEPQLKQRFEFGSRGTRGSSWATDWPKAIRGLNELARTAGVPCAGTPVSFLAWARKAKIARRGQHFVRDGLCVGWEKRDAPPRDISPRRRRKNLKSKTN